ncbi:hypothetical protein HPB51_025962 [Rhipicephalus microplus]|uniref:BRCT domain-containing protein n=1 Tax=Rhipicephalus microplus TaxID=6941 RepID=A0A9J6EEH8_RHIMP|nr:hypothetical protein HPB51_025962 [Rhipicephalus microplus]
MDSPMSERTPPSKKVRFASTRSTPGTPRTGPGVPESVYRELLARPPNNPDGPMRDVCAFIEVRVGTEDVSSTFESVMTRLGATVRRHLGPTVTHVVFREGRVSTRKRALQLAIPMVGPLWVEECLANNRLASPERFPPYVSAAYDCPILSRKIRKPRSWRTKPDSPSPVRQRKRPRLLDLRSEVLLTEEVLSPNEQRLQDIVTRVDKHVLDLPRKCLLSGASSSFPLANPGGLMDTQEPPTSLTELAQVEQQSLLPELPSKTDCRISRRSLEDFSTNVAGRFRHASWPPEQLLQGPRSILCADPERAYLGGSSKAEASGAATRARAFASGLILREAATIFACKRAAGFHTITWFPVRMGANVHPDVPNANEFAYDRALRIAHHGSSGEFAGGDARKYRDSLLTFHECRARARALSRASWLEGPSIVLTGLEQVDRDAIGAIVKAVGGFTIEAEVTDRTTHVICGSVAGKPRRTLHVLFALARGNCWLLPVRWAYQSLECGRWLEEGAFAFSRPRLATGKKRKLLGCEVADAPLLDGQGPFYIGPATAPPPDRVRDLLLLLGAEVLKGFGKVGSLSVSYA